MSEKDWKRTDHQATIPWVGLHVNSGLRAGYTCPSGWWKKREGKKKMCCHWSYDPYWHEYYEDCTT